MKMIRRHELTIEERDIIYKGMELDKNIVWYGYEIHSSILQIHDGSFHNEINELYNKYIVDDDIAWNKYGHKLILKMCEIIFSVDEPLYERINKLNLLIIES